MLGQVRVERLLVAERGFALGTRLQVVHVDDVVTVGEREGY